MENKRAEVKYIPIKNIRPNPYQPRKNFDKKALDELSQSIKAYGVIQPISLRHIKDDSYELIAGERRLRASELAMLDDIPAIIVNYKDKDSALIALIENLQREDLNFIEEAEGYKNLIVDHGYTQEEVASQIGKSQSAIANKLRILKLAPDIKGKLLDHELSERHGRALLKLSDDDLKRKVLDKIIKDDLNVRKTEALIDHILEDLSKDEEEIKKQNIKSLISVRIYLNTIKKAFSVIKESGVKAQYEEVDKGDHVEVIVKIPKK